MRKLLPLVCLAISCATQQTAPPAGPPAAFPTPVEATAAAEAHGLTIEEEAGVLALEDRREHDPAIVDAWVSHPNALHRIRIALALGRISPHTRTGVQELAKLATDSDRRVREMAAFSLGEGAIPSALPTVITLTSDDDAGVGAEAIEALSKFAADRSLLPQYLSITGQATTEGTRARAVRYLFRWDDDRASEAARQALGATSPAVRQEAAYSLSRRVYVPARDELLLVMNDPSTLTRAYAATALGRIADAAAYPAMIAALGDVHPWVRTNAAVALSRIIEKHPTAPRAQDLPRIFAASEDPDPGVRAVVIDTLGAFASMNDTARARLLDRLRNGSQWEREQTAGAIAKHLPWDLASQHLTGLTPWQIVRVLEASAGSAHGAAVRAQYATHESPLVRATALSTIPDDRAEAEIESIRSGLNDPDIIVRTNAYDRFGSTQASDRVQILRDAEQRERRESMNDGRLSAIGTLAKIDFPERAAFLQSLAGDGDPVVRRTTSELIATALGIAAPAYAPLPVVRTAEEYAEIVRWSREPHTATIHMTRGKIELALLAQDAPMTAWNFAQLARRKFYDNTSFMRVVPNFVIQGGDPRNDMNGGPGYAIRDEINLQKYTRGAVGMALSGPDTGGSQFFITHSPQPHLDGGYTIFGRAWDGMSGVVDQTERGDRVVTITIDEHSPVGVSEISSVRNVSLPLEVGEMTTARLLERVPEYAEQRDQYAPDLTVLEMMKSYVQATDRVEIYMGTWCPDSLREIPKYLRIVDDLRSQFGVEIPTTFYALDRSKQSPPELIAGKGVDKVSTFIYYRGDQELGRIVEKPQSPLFEDDLLAIVAKP